MHVHFAMLVEAFGEWEAGGHGRHAPASILSVALLYVPARQGISLAALHPARPGMQGKCQAQYSTTGHTEFVLWVAHSVPLGIFS